MQGLQDDCGYGSLLISKKITGSAVTQVVSLFVENIPKVFHWKGLWFLFSRYGNVVGAFIANKLSRKGKRFGFVRFGSKVEAERCMEKLNGFVLNDCKLSVQFEKSRGLSRMGGLRDADREIRMAELWGNFESFCENADQSIDCENITILITTNLDKRINEAAEIEIGNNIQLVQVWEIGISDDVGTTTQLVIKQKLKGGSNDHKEDFHMSSTEEDNSDVSSVKIERTEEVRVAELTACCFGNEFIRNDDTQLHEKSRLLNESELSGGGNILVVHDSSPNDGFFGVDVNRVEGSKGKVIASLEEHVDINQDAARMSRVVL
ncbi:hypothetical protein F3Y22_tig00011277pilonHSYRG00082 [Hibiscus syriacus]|uniref:RRM domain-containing protein n=1 Tax=Hibiscus syriacus TaxID=106335 RepID=A0A6A3C4J2_HIBSY|nr:hypothetical protein F3Y22_tig00011277pilonHSYRG00082 [Hibiscus syriacus]